MPGRASLDAAEYYAHPRNAFWPIMGALFGASPDNEYSVRCQRLRDSGVAVWDVLRCCRREGSLDASIDAASEVPNDFATFFAEHPDIVLIGFNGQKAESAFRKHVVGALDESLLRSLETRRLPSTSPAHAGRSFEEKLQAWRDALARDA